MRRDVIEIEGAGPGTRHQLPVLRFGAPGARPKVYVQGGLHADEAPGMVAALALADRLEALEAAGKVRGEIVVVPAANPIGLSQRLFGAHEGRFDLRDGGNFNRGFPALTDDAAARLEGRLGPDAALNAVAVRGALAAALAALRPRAPADRLKHALLALSLDADLVLDLHCDAEAEMHLYCLTPQVAAVAPLAARLGARALLTAEISGHDPFDEANSRPWAELAARFPAHPLGPGCVAVTVELRGEADADLDLGARDAAAMIDHLTAIGALAGAAPPAPAPLCDPTPLSGTDTLEAPAAGIICYRRPLGALIEAGEMVAELLDPVTGARVAVTASASGVFYARAGGRLAEIGQRLGKIAGAAPLRAGPLLGP